MLLLIKLGNVTLFGLFCFSLILDTVLMVVFNSCSFILWFCGGKKSMLCVGASTKIVANFLPICLHRQAYSNSVFF